MAKGHGSIIYGFRIDGSSSEEGRLWIDIPNPRSALSVSANIAEAFGREHTLNKLNFYYNARGSLSETKSHAIYGNRVKYFTDSEFGNLDFEIQEIWKEINKIIATLRSQSQAKS